MSIVILKSESIELISGGIMISKSKLSFIGPYPKSPPPLFIAYP
jgi:hypothetical protein